MPVIEDKYSRWASATVPSQSHRDISAAPCSTRLRRGSFIADIVPDNAGDCGRPIYHLIVQRLGSPELLGLAQETTFRGALEQAHESLERLVQQRRKRRQRAAIYKFGA